jgi:hypothetical protein
MLLLPLIILAIAGYGVYTLVHHRPHPANGIVDESVAVAARQTPFWPTTIAGKFAIGALALGVVPVVLVNVVQVPYLVPVVLSAAFVLAGVARFVEHDHSTSVLIVFAVSALAVLAGLLFLAGEIFIGHD